MDHFFRRSNSDSFKFLHQDASRWNFTRSAPYNQAAKQNLLKLMKTKGIRRAVPGGKYGCALMLKQLYREYFEDVSLGKMVALIKKSLEKQYFLHFKTLIMKNDRNKLNSKQRIKLTNEAKQLTLQLLRNSGENGISLSQLPLLL